MAEVTVLGDNNFSGGDGGGLEDAPEIQGEPNGLENLERGSLELSVAETQPVLEVSAAPDIYRLDKVLTFQTPRAEDRCGNLKTKAFSVSNASVCMENSVCITSEFAVPTHFCGIKCREVSERQAVWLFNCGREISAKVPFTVTAVATGPIDVVTALLARNTTAKLG